LAGVAGGVAQFLVVRRQCALTNIMEQKQPNGNGAKQSPLSFLWIGIVLGAGIGIATGNLAVGTGIGIALALAFGFTKK